MGHPNFMGFFKRECQRRIPKSSGVLWFPFCFPPFRPQFCLFRKYSKRARPHESPVFQKDSALPCCKEGYNSCIQDFWEKLPPIPSIHVWYIYLHLFDVYDKCRYTIHGSYGQYFTAKMPLRTRWNNLLTRNHCWSGKSSKTGAQGVLKLADFGLAREFVDLQMLGFSSGDLWTPRNQGKMKVKHVQTLKIWVE